MDKKKIYQQKLLARILLVCAGIILLTSFLNHHIGSSFAIGLFFGVVGLLTLRKVKQVEDELIK